MTSDTTTDNWPQIKTMMRARDMRKAWTRSLSEEVLSVLYIIAAIEAYKAGIIPVAIALGIKAFLDVCTSIRCAFYEWGRIRKAVQRDIEKAGGCKWITHDGSTFGG